MALQGWNLHLVLVSTPPGLCSLPQPSLEKWQSRNYSTGASLASPCSFVLFSLWDVSMFSLTHSVLSMLDNQSDTDSLSYTTLTHIHIVQPVRNFNVHLHASIAHSFFLTLKSWTSYCCPFMACASRTLNGVCKVSFLLSQQQVFAYLSHADGSLVFSDHSVRAGWWRAWDQSITTLLCNAW